MTLAAKKAVFVQSYASLSRATDRLRRTLDRVRGLGDIDEARLATLSDAESDLVDALAMRYARCQDLLGPCLRSLAALEVADTGDFNKLLTKMRQFGVVVSIADWNAERLLRNHIGHEYLQTDGDVALFIATVRDRGNAVCGYAPRIYDHAVSALGFDASELGPRPRA